MHAPVQMRVAACGWRGCCARRKVCVGVCERGWDISDASGSAPVAECTRGESESDARSGPPPASGCFCRGQRGGTRCQRIAGWCVRWGGAASARPPVFPSSSLARTKQSGAAGGGVQGVRREQPPCARVCLCPPVRSWLSIGVALPALPRQPHPSVSAPRAPRSPPSSECPKARWLCGGWVVAQRRAAPDAGGGEQRVCGVVLWLLPLPCTLRHPAASVHLSAVPQLRRLVLCGCAELSSGESNRSTLSPVCDVHTHERAPSEGGGKQRR